MRISFGYLHAKLQPVYAFDRRTRLGELVSNNFEILDTNLNDLQTQINAINENLTTLNLATSSGTRILSISLPTTITSENFSNYASYDGNDVYIAQFYGNTTFSSIPQPPHSCRLMIIVVNGDATFSGSINTYPTSLLFEKPPNSELSNTYSNQIHISNFSSCTLSYTANGNNSQLIIDQNDYITFLGKLYYLSIPHAIAAGGKGAQDGTAGTQSNTCNGGGGGYSKGGTSGTGCIFGQYEGGDYDNYSGYGYGSSTADKYRCGLVIIANGNVTINNGCTITQNGGDGSSRSGGYGGGCHTAGGGGAPVFIYYTGKYRNNGSINVNGGSAYLSNSAGSGGAGGIKVTKISI